MSAPAQLDPYVQAHQDAVQAVITFLPSLTAQPAPPAPPPMPPMSPQIKEGIRAISLARKVELASKRVARGLPPEEPPPPSPQETFPPAIDQVHIRALQSAIAAHPETARAGLMHEATLNLTKWIAAHNGAVNIDGHMEIANGPESAEKLAARIVNEAVDQHDQREQAKKEAALGVRAEGDKGKGSERDSGANGARPSGVQVRPQDRGNPDASAGAGSVTQGTSADVPSGGGGAHGSDISVGGTDPATGRTVTQSSADLDEAQDIATSAAPELKDTLGGVVDSVDGVEVDGVRESKDPDRAQQKADVDEKPVHTQTDLLAGRIAVDSPEAKDAAVAKLRAAAPVIDEDDHFQDGDPEYGFRSHDMQVALGDGKTSAEVQVVPKEIAQADDDTHDTYEKGREAEASGDDETAKAAMAENKDTHDKAMDKFNERNADRPTRIVKSLEGAGFKVRGAPVKIGGHLFVPVVDDEE